VHSAIEDFAQELAHVTRRFLQTKAWEKTERIVVGGGLRDSQLGELAIARTEIILKAEDFKIEMLPIRHHPDDAGLIGALHLAPSWIFEVMIPFSPSTSAARTSVAVSSKHVAGSHRTCPRRACGSPIYGAMPTTSRAVRRR
jgi:hypothetical protein